MSIGLRVHSKAQVHGSPPSGRRCPGRQLSVEARLPAALKPGHDLGPALGGIHIASHRGIELEDRQPLAGGIAKAWMGEPLLPHVVV
ncbi:MAG: hypothetical protein QOF83_4013 [Solirubrobacteraceae bacterium]|nr:hypothetical protein [Solirubrobacteraceae bacterium]